MLLAPARGRGGERGLRTSPAIPLSWPLPLAGERNMKGRGMKDQCRLISARPTTM